MPNWCDNNVIIKGTSKDIKKFINKLDKTYVNDEVSHIRVCESIYPQPEILNMVNEGRNKDGAEYWWNVNEKGEKVKVSIFDMFENEENDIQQVPLTIAEMVDLTLEHDSFNWYDWRTLYWGSKSGDVYTQLEIEDKKIRLFHESAWGPLFPLWKYVSKEHNFNIEIKWHEEGGNYGTIIFDKGELIKEDKSFHDWYTDDNVKNQEGAINEEE